MFKLARRRVPMKALWLPPPPPSSEGKLEEASTSMGQVMGKVGEVGAGGLHRWMIEKEKDI